MVIIHREVAEVRMTKERNVSYYDAFQGQYRGQDHHKKGKEIREPSGERRIRGAAHMSRQCHSKRKVSASESTNGLCCVGLCVWRECASYALSLPASTPSQSYTLSPSVGVLEYLPYD